VSTLVSLRVKATKHARTFTASEPQQFQRKLKAFSSSKNPMLGITDYLTFVITVLVFLLVPGPGNLALITSTTKGGIRGGLAATLGVILGDQVLMWSAVAGVAALLTAYPDAFHAVQWLGAAYLAWLGAKMLLAKPGAAPVLNIKPRHYLKQALMITLLNPKAILFYMAFFPLFVDPARQQGLVTYAFMAVTIAVLTFGYGLASTLLTYFFAQKIRANPVISRVLEKVAGLFLVGFGLKLAVSR
jgi:threonine/homoserine/homoserine lactone efflux protein